MIFSVYTIPIFDKQAKRLGKKYPSLKIELKFLAEKLNIEPDLGTPLGNNFYKIRLSIDSKGRGKSAGARVVTYVKFNKEEIYLCSIYDKSEKNSISDKELSEIFDIIP